MMTMQTLTIEIQTEVMGVSWSTSQEADQPDECEHSVQVHGTDGRSQGIFRTGCEERRDAADFDFD